MFPCLVYTMRLVTVYIRNMFMYDSHGYILTTSIILIDDSAEHLVIQSDFLKFN